jgi:sec-independent protein translocase protein TatA
MHLAVLLFFSNLFSTDMIVILIVALVLFGGDKLPEIARTLGKGIRDFKEASEGVKREINNQIYAYEEKKQEQKLDEIAKSTHEAQSTPAENPVESRPPVANTIPYNDGASYTESPAAPVETPTTEAGQQVAGHAPAEHPENEVSKNS